MDYSSYVVVSDVVACCVVAVYDEDGAVFAVSEARSWGLSVVEAVRLVLAIDAAAA